TRLFLDAFPRRIDGYRRPHLDEHHERHPHQSHRPNPEVDEEHEDDGAHDEEGHAAGVWERGEDARCLTGVVVGYRQQVAHRLTTEPGQREAQLVFDQLLADVLL